MNHPQSHKEEINNDHVPSKQKKGRRFHLSFLRVIAEIDTPDPKGDPAGAACFRSTQSPSFNLFPCQIVLK